MVRKMDQDATLYRYLLYESFVFTARTVNADVDFQLAL
jgi:hypothetical protein